MNTQNPKNGEEGYVLLGVLFLLSLALVITEGMLDSSATNSKTRAVVNTQSRYYYEVEQTLNNVVGWLQANSKYIVDGFSKDNFDDNFDLGSPSFGDNEGEHFGVPTLVKLKGTNSSVMLSNNDFFGTDAFPNVAHIDTGASWDPIAEFDAADLGPANARVVLIWARDSDGDYEPIFRVDVVTGNNPDRGVHSFSYVQSTLVSTEAADPGFYGRDSLNFNTGNNDCFSFLFTGVQGNWNAGAPRANCPVASDGMINTKGDINGTADSLADPGITLENGGSISGDTCEGGGCHAYVLPDHGKWADNCAGGSNGNVTITADTTWSTGGCWDTVSINNNQTLTLSDTSNPYYIRNLDYSGNNSELAVADIALDEEVEIYVEIVNNDHFNGNRLFNMNNAPHQVRLYYTGDNELKLNGTAQMNLVVESSYAAVDVQGNFNFYGAIRAPQLEINGNARVNYDENLNDTTPVLVDMNFSLKKSSQRYR